MIYDIDEYRPHLVIKGEVMVHIIQMRTFELIVQRKLKISEVEGIDDFMPSIIQEWLEIMT